MERVTDKRLTEIYENKDNFYRDEIRSMAKELIELRERSDWATRAVYAGANRALLHGDESSNGCKGLV